MGNDSGENKEDPIPGLKAIIFDMDGVIVESHDAWYEAARGLMRMWGEDLTMEEFNRRCWGIPFGSAWRRNGMPIEDMKVAREMLMGEYFKAFGKVRLFDGVTGLFGLLESKGIKTALLTNTPKWAAEKIMEKLGLEFDVMPDLSEMRMKPNPDGIFFILKKLSIEKDEAAFIGDTRTDEEAGKAAGVKTLMVGRDIASVTELPGKLGL
jgi:HAD superfamily hydrolase (TIGR01549 family)